MQQGGYPPQQGGYPPPQGGGYGYAPAPYYPQQGGYPPQQGGYGGYPPPQGGYPPQQGGYPPPQQGGGDADLRIKTLELEVQKLQLENQQLRLELQQLRGGGGGGYPPQQGGQPPGYPPQQGGYPPPQQQQQGGGRPGLPTRLYDAWKLTWDDEKSSKSGVLYCSGKAPRQTWVKSDPSFNVDFITSGQTTVQFWDIESAQSTRQFEKPSTWNGYMTVGFDVLEDRRQIIFGCNPSFNGNLILTYNIDTQQWNELRKDSSEEGFKAFHCLGGQTPSAVASDGQNLRLFDLNTGRPTATFKLPAWCEYIRKDPLNPNLVYATCGDKILAFDKNSKTQVRTFLGLQSPGEIQVPVVPGTQIIANDNKACKIWDVGTGKVVHEVPSNWGLCSSLYGNIVAVCETSDMKVYDLLESATEPAKILPQGYQTMQEVFVTPQKILLMTSYVWITTPFSPAPAGSGGY